MKLYHAALSPFVRKVVVAAIELGLRERIELVATTVSPVKPSEALNAVNPLGKIPALVTDDNDLLYDSSVIVEYLDELAGGGKLIPRDGAERFRVKRLEALADGMADAAILARYEIALRPEAKRWDEWVKGQTEKVMRGFDMLESAAWLFDDRIDAGKIAVGAHVGYIDLRFPDLGWRQGRETIARWYAAFSERPSMAATRPVAP
jgi:glutathione S-transferase